MSLNAILQEVAEERIHQNAKWGAPHDAGHSNLEWVALITKHAGMGVLDIDSEHDLLTFRRQMIRVAALAVAAIERVDKTREANSLNTTPGTPVDESLLERHIEAIRASSQVMTRTTSFVMSPVEAPPDTPVLFVRIADPDGSPTHGEHDGMLSLAHLGDIERLNVERRKALSILHQIYDLELDPKDAYIAARARGLLDAQE